jgi:hypothetical protein
VYRILLRPKNTKCPSALTFVRRGDARRCSSSTLSTRQFANKASGKLTITDSIHGVGLRLFGSQLTLSGTGAAQTLSPQDARPRRAHFKCEAINASARSCASFAHFSS